MLDGCGLGRSCYGIELTAKASCFLAVVGDFALQTAAQAFLACEGGVRVGCPRLRGGESSLGLRELRGQSSRLLIDPGALQFKGLELYEMFGQSVHRCKEEYSIWAHFRAIGGLRIGRCMLQRESRNRDKFRELSLLIPP